MAASLTSLQKAYACVKDLYEETGAAYGAVSDACDRLDRAIDLRKRDRDDHVEDLCTNAVDRIDSAAKRLKSLTTRSECALQTIRDAVLVPAPAAVTDTSLLRVILKTPWQEIKETTSGVIYNPKNLLYRARNLLSQSTVRKFLAEHDGMQDVATDDDETFDVHDLIEDAPVALVHEALLTFLHVTGKKSRILHMRARLMRSAAVGIVEGGRIVVVKMLIDTFREHGYPMDAEFLKTESEQAFLAHNNRVGAMLLCMAEDMCE